MFWRLWWRAITVKRSQAVLALAALTVGATVTSMLLNLYGDVRRKMSEEFRAYGANVVIAPAAGSGAAAESSTLAEEAVLGPVTGFTRQSPGAWFTPVLYGVVQISPSATNSRERQFTNVVAAGADLGALRRLEPGRHSAGEDASKNLPSGACAVGGRVASRLHVKIGDSLEMRRVPSASETNPSPPAEFSTWRIAAVLKTGAAEDDQVFIPLPALQSLLGLAGRITLVELSIPGGTREVENSLARLAALLPGLEVRPVRQIVYSDGKVLGTIRWLMLSLTALILVIIAFCVMAAMTAVVMERRKEVGVMKALGASDGLLMRLFVAEGAGLGVLGGVLGFAAGAGIAGGVEMRLFAAPLHLKIWTLPVICGLTTALAVLSTQAPVRIMRAIQPTVVLKGE